MKLKSPYYFMKICRGFNAHGQKMYEHCYFQTRKEAEEQKALCVKQGEETTDIEEVYE